MKTENKATLRFFVVLGFLWAAAGCSVNDQAQRAPDPEVDNTQIAASQDMTITTSHGTQTIEPNVVGYSEAKIDDPLEFINRPIFTFNNYLYRYLLIPVGNGYLAVVPQPVREKVSNFFANLREPLNALNHLLQGEGTKSTKNVGRFLINSTVGLLGLFDPADSFFGIDQHKTSFDKTLRHYDVGYGSFLVLPVLGQSDFRNLISTVTESSIAPIRYVTDEPQTTFLRTYEAVHSFAPQGDTYKTLHDEAQDPYIFFRNMYVQGLLRDAQYPASPARIDIEQQGTHSSEEGRD